MQRIRVFPDSGNFAQTDIFPVGTDGNAQLVVDACHGGAVPAGLLLGELPSFAVVEGVRGNAGSERGNLIVPTDNNHFIFISASDGEDSRGGVAVGYRCFSYSPGVP